MAVLRCARRAHRRQRGRGGSPKWHQQYPEPCPYRPGSQHTRATSSGSSQVTRVHKLGTCHGGLQCHICSAPNESPQLHPAAPSRLTLRNGPHNVVRKLKAAAVRAEKDGTIGAWPPNKTKHKLNSCPLCVEHGTERGQRQRITYCDTTTTVTTSCAACKVFLWTRKLPAERSTCWEKWRTQQQLQRPNGGVPFQRKKRARTK